MQRSTIAIMLVAATVATVMPVMPALAQDAAKPPAGTVATTGPAPTTGPVLAIDPAQLPPLPHIVPSGKQDQMALVATGAGAAIAVILADIVTGGLLLAPLGVTGTGSLLGLGGAAPATAAAAAAAAAAPVYSVAQRLISGIITIAVAWGGGYLGGHIARTHPELLGLQE